MFDGLSLCCIVQCSEIRDNSALYVNCLVKFKTLRDKFEHDNQLAV